MTEPLTTRAGNAMIWRLVQLGGVKAIFLVRVLVLGRLLGPDEFGLFAVALIALDFLLSITNFGMIPALVQRDHSEPRHYDAAWTVNLLRATIVGVVVFAAAPLIAGLFTEPRATDLIRVLACRPLLEAGASIGIATLTRQLRFRPLAAIKLSEAIVNTLLSVALVGPLGVWALVVGPLTGATAGLVLSYMVAPHRPRILFDGNAIRPLLRFGSWIFASALVATLGSTMLQLAMVRRIGAAELGLYFLAGKLAFLPTEIGVELVGAVAFPLYAQLQHDARRAILAFQRILTGMIAILLPASLLIFIIAPILVDTVLGPRWQGTVPVIRVLACANVIWLAGDAIVPVLKGLGRPDRVTVLDLVQSGLLIVLAWELAGRFGAVGAGFAWLVAAAVSQLLAVYFLRRLLPGAWTGMAGPLIAVVAATLAGAAAAWGVVQWHDGPAGLIGAIGVDVLVTVGFLGALDRVFGLRFRQTIAEAFPSVRTAWSSMTGLHQAEAPTPPVGRGD